MAMDDILKEMNNTEESKSKSNEGNEQEIDVDNIDYNSFNLFGEEKPKVDEKNSEKISNRIDSKFVELNKKEQEIESKLRELNEKLDKINSGGSFSEQIKLKEMAKENPLKVLEILGLDYEELTKKVLAENTPENQIKQEVKQEWKSEIDKLKEELQKKEKENNDKNETQVYNSYIGELNKKIQNSKEAKFINAMGRYGDVVEAIQSYYEKMTPTNP